MGSTNLLHDTLLRANREPILKLVLREVDFGMGFFILDLANRFFDVPLRRRHVCSSMSRVKERVTG